MRILCRSILPFLAEGKLENLQTKYPDLSKEIKELSERDPTSTKKYLDYGVKVLVSGKALVPEIGDVIVLFHKYQNKLDVSERDINSWKNFTELRDRLFEIQQLTGGKSKTTNKKELKASGSKKLYEDDQAILVHVLSKEASCSYGSGTKWCVTMKDRTYFEDYTSRNIILIYLLRKDINEEDSDYKVALVFQRDFDNKIIERQYFDAEDTEYKNPKPLKDVKNLQQILDIAESTAISAPKSNLTKLINGEITIEQLPESERTIETYKIVLEKSDQPLPINILKKLLSDEDERYNFASIISRKTWISSEQLLQLAKHWPEFYWYILMNSEHQIPLEIVKRLVKDGEDQNLEAVARAKWIPENVMLDMMKSSIRLTKYVLIYAPRIKFPVTFLQQYGTRGDRTEKTAIAKRVETPWSVLQAMLNDKNMSPSERDDIRSIILERPDVPVEMLQQAAKDKDFQIRMSIAKNKSTPQETLRMLSSDTHDAVINNVVSNPNTPSDVLTKLSGHESYYTRKLIATNPNTPHDIVMSLKRDLDQE